jgi:hypothetical protein
LASKLKSTIKTEQKICEKFNLVIKHEKFDADLNTVKVITIFSLKTESLSILFWLPFFNRAKHTFNKSMPSKELFKKMVKLLHPSPYVALFRLLLQATGASALDGGGGGGVSYIGMCARYHPPNRQYPQI